MNVMWETLDAEVQIIVHSQESIKDLLSDKKFESQAAYEQYVVGSSVKNLEEIRELVRAYVKQHASDPYDGARKMLDDLHHELYRLVCSVNPLLRIYIDDPESKMIIEHRQPSIHNHKKQKAVEEYVCPAALPPEQEKRLQDVAGDYMLSLPTRMNQWIIGQEDAVKILTDSIITAFARIKEPRIPVGNYIFIGNTGIGKTYTAQTLCDVMIGTRKALHRFDMSEFAEGHEYTKLIGAPSGYRGYEKGGMLTNAVAAWPFCVILADEIEEAHEKTRKIFLVVMDEGHLKDGQGNEVEFGEATLIMTSNVGTEDVKSYQKRSGFKDPNVPIITQRAKEDTLRKAVEEFFPPKFLNRIDEVIYFRDLEWDEYLKIADLELKKTTSLVSTNSSIVITPTPDVVKWVRDMGCDLIYGARPLKRFIKQYFRLPLAHEILGGNLERGDKVTADMFNGRLHFEKE